MREETKGMRHLARMAETRNARVLPIPILTLTNKSLGAPAVSGIDREEEDEGVASPEMRGSIFD